MENVDTMGISWPSWSIAEVLWRFYGTAHHFGAKSSKPGGDFCAFNFRRGTGLPCCIATRTWSCRFCSKTIQTQQVKKDSCRLHRRGCANSTAWKGIDWWKKTSIYIWWFRALTHWPLHAACARANPTLSEGVLIMPKMGAKWKQISPRWLELGSGPRTPHDRSPGRRCHPGSQPHLRQPCSRPNVTEGYESEDSDTTKAEGTECIPIH